MSVRLWPDWAIWAAVKSLSCAPHRGIDKLCELLPRALFSQHGQRVGESPHFRSDIGKERDSRCARQALATVREAGETEI